MPIDHNGVFATPNTNLNQPPTRTKIKKSVRPIPDSLLHIFQTKLESENFEVLNNLPIQEMVSRFQSVTNNLFCQTFPQKEITVSPEDQPWFNEQLRKLKRLRLKEYSRHGHSEKYNEIRIKFEVMSKAAIKKYKNKIDIEVTEGKRGSSYPALKRMGLRPGEQTQSAFQLPNHAELNLTSAQSAELIAEHFSSISQEYAPLDVSSLPPNVQTFLLNNDQRLAPTLTSQDIHYRIIKAKKPNG